MTCFKHSTNYYLDIHSCKSLFDWFIEETPYLILSQIALSLSLSLSLSLWVCVCVFVLMKYGVWV